MPSKYDRVLPKLPMAAPERPPYQERVEQFKLTVTDVNSVSLAKEYARLRAEKARIEEELLAPVNIRIAAYEQLMIESLESGAPEWGQYGASDDTIRLPTGDKVKVLTEIYASVVDPEAFRLWCIGNGYERKLQLPWQTRNSIVKERLIVGDPEPDGTQALARRTIRFTPLKAEKITDTGKF